MKHLWPLALVVGLFAFTGCSNENEEVVEQQHYGQTRGADEKATAFISDDNAVTSDAATRTVGVYTGSSIKFYWTSGDKLWIKESTLKQSVKDDIDERIAANGNGRAEMAKFYFQGVYTNPTYLLRYTGNGNDSGDKVTIKASQSQVNPNNARHLGTDGDCGTATAHRQANGTYLFSVNHKAAYITFAPYYSKEKLDNSVSITNIRVTANENLAGTYAFDDNGIQTSTVYNPSKSVTLALNNTFKVPHVSDYTMNGAIMVVAPGTYTNFTIEYTLSDSRTGVSGTISKTYNSLTLDAGKNKVVKYDFAMNRYPMEYYMWDPGKHYWNGYTGKLPITDNEKASFPAQGTNRYFNGNGVNLYAVNACRICPNANEATLYAFRGDPHWDGKTLWVMNHHLYIGGMWFKKLQYIEGGYASPVTMYPDGHDYRQNSEWRNWDELTPAKYHDKWINRPAQGKPQNTSKYFFLPAMGYLDNHNSEGQLKIGAYGTYFGFYNGYNGAYWTSTSVRKTNTSLQAVSLHFSHSEVGLEVDDRKWAYPIFKIQ
ncbi:hypothetical protein [Prevotella intermedia]|uniref:Uncharacterized protein n=1 Tax=Prevotella intermedia TaxID=28131 RepID=A0A2D3LME6_PREIN|nr:hypothetical protein [Prevotella intermedia]ATV31762.1 hypothetical protein CTM46_09520 [Prevotella intermedia]PJI21145.1 hypothetical protein CTM45_09900 [Prevotella intermedia]